MKTAIATALLMSTLAAVQPPAREIDPARSRAQFSVQHIWVERVKGTVPIVTLDVALK